MTYQEAIEAMERDFLPKVMAEHGWSQVRAHKALGISRKTLGKKLKALGIKTPEGIPVTGRPRNIIPRKSNPVPARAFGGGSVIDEIMAGRGHG